MSHGMYMRKRNLTYWLIMRGAVLHTFFSFFPFPSLRCIRERKEGKEGKKNHKVHMRIQALPHTDHDGDGTGGVLHGQSRNGAPQQM